MKIQVLKNFGLNGENLEAGAIVVVNKSHFGDNEASFRDEGYFVDYAEPAPEPEASAKKSGKGSGESAPPAEGTDGSDPA